MTKKKILWVGEASYLNSGYANYSRETLSRLHKTGKYEVAELAGYGHMNDPRVKQIPWKYYANAPEESDPQEVKQQYKSRPTHEFGEWRFDKTLLDFRPDVVCSIRDPWMDSFILNSHLRPYYSVLMMPTADSIYLQPEWLHTYSKCDSVLTYTEWSKKVLDIESGNSINTIGAAPYGIDYDMFSPPKDLATHKESMGFSGDSIFVGTVMRNQKRKLFPDLIQAFANALDKLPDEISNKLYLYLHTSYPDKACWDIPRLITEAGIGSKVVISYICKSCKRSSSMIFQDARTRCPHCQMVACVTPTVGFGYTQEQLADVYRLFDLYVQYSVSEGFGCPMIEAAATGVPIAAVNFSAMEDVTDRLEGYKVKIQRYFREFESHMLRAYPDNDHLTDIIVKHCQLPKTYIQRKREKIRKLSQEYFNWDRVGKIWENTVDGIVMPKRKWTDGPLIYGDPSEINKNCLPLEFVKTVFTRLFYEPKNIYNIHGMGLLRDLNFGATITQNGAEPLDRNKIIERLRGKWDGRNLSERVRCGMQSIIQDRFIEFANTREIKTSGV